MRWRRLWVGRGIALVHAAFVAAVIGGGGGCDGAAVATCASMPDAPECRPDIGADAARDAEPDDPQDGADPAICAMMPRLPGCTDCERQPGLPACRDAAEPEDAGPVEDDAAHTDAGGEPLDAGDEPLDAGHDAGALDAAPLDAGPVGDAGGSCPSDVPCACAPGTRVGCATTDHCVLAYEEAHADGGITATRCVEQGPTLAGFACDPEIPRCFQFFQCTENWMSDRVCLHICETSADCGIGLMCHPSPEQGWASVGGRTYGVCLPRPP